MSLIDKIAAEKRNKLPANFIRRSDAEVAALNLRIEAPLPDRSLQTGKRIFQIVENPLPARCGPKAGRSPQEKFVLEHLAGFLKLSLYRPSATLETLCRLHDRAFTSDKRKSDEHVDIESSQSVQTHICLKLVCEICTS